MARYIEYWKLLNDKPIMITDSKGNPVYDMYKIEITYNTGDSKTIKVFCEYGTDIPKEIRNNFYFGIYGEMMG